MTNQNNPSRFWKSLIFFDVFKDIFLLVKYFLHLGVTYTRFYPFISGSRRAPYTVPVYTRSYQDRREAEPAGFEENRNFFNQIEIH